MTSVPLAERHPHHLASDPGPHGDRRVRLHVPDGRDLERDVEALDERRGHGDRGRSGRLRSAGLQPPSAAATGEGRGRIRSHGVSFWWNRDQGFVGGAGVVRELGDGDEEPGAAWTSCARAFARALSAVRRSRMDRRLRGSARASPPRTPARSRGGPSRRGPAAPPSSPRSSCSTPGRSPAARTSRLRRPRRARPPRRSAVVHLLEAREERDAEGEAERPVVVKGTLSPRIS